MLTIRKFTITVQDSDGKRQTFKVSGATEAIAREYLRGMLVTGTVINVVHGWKETNPEFDNNSQ